MQTYDSDDTITRGRLIGLVGEGNDGRGCAVLCCVCVWLHIANCTMCDGTHWKVAEDCTLLQWKDTAERDFACHYHYHFGCGRAEDTAGNRNLVGLHTHSHDSFPCSLTLIPSLTLKIIIDGREKRREREYSATHSRVCHERVCVSSVDVVQCSAGGRQVLHCSRSMLTQCAHVR